jgi:hypothetical protein
MKENTPLKTNEREGKCVCEKVSKALCGWTQQVLKLVLCRIILSVPSLIVAIKKENGKENHPYP